MTREQVIEKRTNTLNGEDEKERRLNRARTILLSPEKSPCSHCIYQKACDAWITRRILGEEEKDAVVHTKVEGDRALLCELGVYRYVQREEEAEKCPEPLEEPSESLQKESCSCLGRRPRR